MGYFSIAQEATVSKEKGPWIGNSYIGFAEIRIEDLGTYSSFVFGSNLGKIFLLNKNSSISTAVELQYLYTNIAFVHSKNRFIKVPINYRYSSNNNGSKIFLEIGVYAGILRRSEQQTNTSTEVTTNLGNNYGLNVGLGFLQQIDHHVNFSIKIMNQSDLIESYKEAYNELKIKNLYAVNLGVEIEL